MNLKTLARPLLLLDLQSHSVVKGWGEVAIKRTFS